jgi:hypothetical protein
MPDWPIFRVDIPGDHELASLSRTCMLSGMLITTRGHPLVLDEKGCEQLAAFAGSASRELQRVRTFKELGL